MPERRTVIIGGGLAGVTSLHALVQRGEGATLIEARDTLATGASFANGGMLTASMSDPWNGPGAFEALVKSLLDPYAAMKLRLHAAPGLTGWGLRFLRNSTHERHAAATRNAYALARRSLDVTRQLEAQFGLACDFAHVGTVKVFASREAAAGPIALAEQLKAQGLRYEVLDQDGVIAREPELREARDAFACGIYYPDDASGDARTFTEALAEHARASGGEIQTGVKARRIITQGGRVTGVETDTGVLAAERVIVANGFASPDLTKPLGVSLAIAPAKGYSVTVDAREWNARPTIPVVDDAMHAAVSPLGTRLRFVGTAEFAGENYTIEPARVENLKRLFTRLYPHLASNLERTESIAWAGLRPMSADGLPFIGRAGPEGLWINAGHGHLGWTMAAGSAELLADLITGAKPQIEPHPYRASR